MKQKARTMPGNFFTSSRRHLEMFVTVDIYLSNPTVLLSPTDCYHLLQIKKIDPEKADKEAKKFQNLIGKSKNLTVAEKV